jgi:hypothetical protein
MPRKLKPKKRRPKKAGRPKRDHPIDPKLGAKMIRRMPILFALSIFGPRLTAAELISREKERCKETGTKYNRETAIDEAAKAVRMEPKQLANWLNRSQRSRART